MGTKLPIYGYIDPDATGQPALKDHPKPIPSRAQQVSAVGSILSYLSRPDVQELAYFLIVDGFDPSRDVWCRGVVRESGGEDRTDLLQLVQRIEGNGTILVPTTDELLEHKSDRARLAVEQILEQKITVLAIYNPEAPLSFFTEANGKADSRIFSAMADNVLKVRTRLDSIYANHKSWAF